MFSKELYIIRHGETDFNKKGIVQGRGIDSSLNRNGIKQADKFYKTYQAIPFDIVCYSNLKRTKETVYKFIEDGHYSKSFTAIDELDWGSQEGKKQNEESKMIFSQVLSAWKGGNYEYKLDYGESPLDVQKRLKTFIDFVIKSDYKKILICTHGRSMRILLCTLLNIELKDMDMFPHQNLCLYKIKYIDNVFTVETANCLAHFED